uniref:Uncharacterized protein n=1 Tax=Glossina pallidipes TaxID=7398 RepID=A0A1A9Z541_GLOPL
MCRVLPSSLVVSSATIIGKFLSLIILMVSMITVTCRYSCNMLLKREESWGLCRPSSNTYLRSEVKTDYVTAIGLAYLCKGALSSCVKTEFTDGFPDNLIYAWCNGVDYCKRFRREDSNSGNGKHFDMLLC